MNWTDENLLRIVVKESRNVSEILKSLNLNHKSTTTRQRFFKYCTKYNIDISHLNGALRQTGVWTNIDKQQLQTLVEENCSFSDVLRKLGLKIKGSSLMTLKKYMGFYEINENVLGIRATKFLKPWRLTNDEIFKENSKTGQEVTKRRVLEERLLPYVCVKCNNDGKWLNEKLVLQLEHKNGINNDNRFTNLEFLCPNCHSQTKTWGKKIRNEWVHDVNG